VEYETLNLEEVRLVLAGKKLERPISLGGERLIGETEKRGEGAVIEGI
jgi:ATP-dependent metalloprotease